MFWFNRRTDQSRSFRCYAIVKPEASDANPLVETVDVEADGHNLAAAVALGELVQRYPGARVRIVSTSTL
jgi:hypothetical protein